jgi:hypothetical protein
MVNQQFRRDYWVKGLRKLSRLEQAEHLSAVRVLLQVAREDATLKVTGSLGEASMNEQIYKPIQEFLSDHKPHTIGEIVEAVRKDNINLSQVVEAVTVLGGTGGQLTLAQDPAFVSKGRKRTDKLNRHLMRLARTSGDVHVLASPVTGGGFSLGRFQQLFALAYTEGLRDAPEWAKYAWDILRGQGQRILREGKAIESDEDNLGELNTQAAAFKAKLLPILKALEIV